MMVGAGGADTERGLDEETGETRSAKIWFEIDRDYFVKGSDLFLKGGRTKKQVAGRGTSRYSIGIKS